MLPRSQYKYVAYHKVKCCWVVQFTAGPFLHQLAAAKRASEISRIPLSQLKKMKRKRVAGPTPVEGAAIGEEKRAAVSTPVEEAAVGEGCWASGAAWVGL